METTRTQAHTQFLSISVSQDTTNESAKNKSQVIVLVLGIWLDFGHSHSAMGVEIQQLNGEFDPGSG